MIEIFPEPTEAGLWLQLHQDGMNIIGAHLVPGDRYEDGQVTIMWSGHPSPLSLTSFCSKAFEQLDVHGQGEMSLLGREFRAGKESRFTESRWLDAGAIQGAQLLRFECSATPKSTHPAFRRPTETIVVWAALDKRPPQAPSGDTEWDEDENVGVNLQVPRVQSLEQDLSTLIAKSHQHAVEVTTIQDALRKLVEYLQPRPKALSVKTA